MRERITASQEVFLGREVGLQEKQGYSEQTAALIDQEVSHLLINERYHAVQHLLSQRQEELERLAQEVLDEPLLHRLVASPGTNVAQVSGRMASSSPLTTVAENGEVGMIEAAREADQNC